MPPKRAMNSEDDTEELATSSGTESESNSGEIMDSSGAEVVPMKTMLLNNPNDERHAVGDTRPVNTPPDHEPRRMLSREGGAVSFSSATDNIKSGNKNRPGTSSSRQEAHQSSSTSAMGTEKGVRMLRNNPNDEMVPVEGSHTVATPLAKHRKSSDTSRGIALRNAPHDEAIPVSTTNSSINTPKKFHGRNRDTTEPPHDEDAENNTDDDSSEQDRRSRGYSNQRPEAIETGLSVSSTVVPNLEYKPQDYAKINAGANREMQELFKHILDYQPAIPELPAKLRPFIPDYVPSVGDLDPFCKIPRPDGRPDGLGIYVLDEPSVSQSNPAVVLLELRATNIHSSGGLVEVVDSFEDAANRPEVIDRWIADVRKVHYKKPLPTINYQKPMPEIESLLQVWPSEFEEFLNSDIQFPPPGIDLDLDQYVRTLCCIVDIPTYNSLIDSLHVMFTVYQEFLANQHFQHE